MNERISRWVAAWLAHPTGIFQSLAITAVWLSSPVVFGWTEHTAQWWYLAFCTFVSFATQFTIAFQGRKNELAAAMQLENQAAQMRLLLALTKEIQGDQEEILDELERLVPPVDPVDPVA